MLLKVKIILFAGLLAFVATAKAQTNVTLQQGLNVLQKNAPLTNGITKAWNLAAPSQTSAVAVVFANKSAANKTPVFTVGYAELPNIGSSTGAAIQCEINTFGPSASWINGTVTPTIAANSSFVMFCPTSPSASMTLSIAPGATYNADIYVFTFTGNFLFQNSPLAPNPAQNLLAHVTGAGVHLIKTGAGFVHTVTLNGWTGATSNTLSDDLACGANVIGVIATSAASLEPLTLTFDGAFANGLCLSLAATVDVTISYQ